MKIIKNIIILTITSVLTLFLVACAPTDVKPVNAPNVKPTYDNSWNRNDVIVNKLNTNNLQQIISKYDGKLIDKSKMNELNRYNNLLQNKTMYNIVEAYRKEYFKSNKQSISTYDALHALTYSNAKIELLLNDIQNQSQEDLIYNDVLNLIKTKNGEWEITNKSEDGYDFVISNKVLGKSEHIHDVESSMHDINYYVEQYAQEQKEIIIQELHNKDKTQMNNINILTNRLAQFQQDISSYLTSYDDAISKINNEIDEMKTDDDDNDDDNDDNDDDKDRIDAVKKYIAKGGRPVCDSDNEKNCINYTFLFSAQVLQVAPNMGGLLITDENGYTAFLVINTAGHYYEENLRLIMEPIGTFSYVTITGTENTVRKYKVARENQILKSLNRTLFYLQPYKSEVDKIISFANKNANKDAKINKLNHQLEAIKTKPAPDFDKELLNNYNKKVYR